MNGLVNTLADGREEETGMSLSSKHLSKGPGDRRGLVVVLSAFAGAAFSFATLSGGLTQTDRAPAYLFLWGLWLTIPLLWTFGVPRFLSLTKRERSIVNDELAQRHQASAARFGFVIALTGLLIISSFAFLDAPLPDCAAPALLSLTVVGSCLHFGILQLRAS